MEEKRSSADCDEKMATYLPEEEPNYEYGNHKKAIHEVGDDFHQLEKSPDEPVNQVDVTRSISASETEPRHIYLNWQFLTVFVSISLGFHAGFLGSINSWNGAQAVIPVTLIINPLQNLLAPLSLPEVSSGVNLTTVAAGLDLTQMATGINGTKLESSLNPNKLFWGLSHTNMKEFASGINTTGIAESLRLKEVLSGVKLTQIASGLNLRELMSGLNLKNFLPAAYEGIPASITQLKEGLWIYPTLIFTQILSSVFFGRLSDYVGRRWIFLFGNIVSFAAFLATARVHGGTQTVGLAALTGIGTGIQILGPWLALAELVPVRHRFTVTGLCVTLLAPLIALHAAIAAAFIIHTSEGWRWPYYINAILSFASLTGLFIAYHPPTYHQLHNNPTDEPPAKDWFGLFVFTTSIALVAYALGWGKLIWTWSSPQVIAVITIAGTTLIGFLVYEYNFGNDHNAYPAYLMRSYTHVSQMLLSALGSLMWLFIPIVQLIVFLTVTPRFGMQGAWEHLWGAGLVGGFLLASISLAQPKHLKWHVVLGATFGMVFLAAFRGLVHIDQYRVSMALLFISGLGHGYMTIVTYVTAPMTAHKRDMGLVVGLVSAYRGLIFAVIRGIFLTIYINQVILKARRILPTSFTSVGPIPETLTSLLDGVAAIQTTGNVRGLLQLHIVKTMTDALIAVLAKSWQFVISVAYIYFFIVLIYTFTCPNTDGYLSNRVFVRLNRGGGAFRLPTQK